MSSFAQFGSIYPPHPASPFDWIVPLASVLLVQLSLLAPPTPSIKLLRAGVVAPLAIFGFAYIGYSVTHRDYEEIRGLAYFAAYLGIRVLEFLIFAPAEENNHRLYLRPKVKADDCKTSNGGDNGNTPEQWDIDVDRESIPPPWTIEKFYWALSLHSSLRGIGWSHACRLASTSYEDPYAPYSSRSAYLRKRIVYLVLSFSLFDLARTIMNVSSAAPFFSGRPGAPTYDDLTITEKIVYSLCIATRVWHGMERFHIPLSIFFIYLGGVMGWEGEWWSPWGWPPVFGGLGDLLSHPGLSTMWSRTWHQYSRRWLQLFGVIGIGEKILRLSPSAPRPPKTPDNPSQTSEKSPEASGRISTRQTPMPRTPHALSPQVVLSSLIKTLIVFILTACIHDFACFILLLHTSPPGKSVKLSDAITTFPFFLVQPFALAFEAGVKSTWRGWKAKQYKPRDKQDLPSWVTLFERVIGFIWTWGWLGWTAGWWIQGLVRIGLYRRDADQPVFPSLFGGLIYGVWHH